MNFSSNEIYQKILSHLKEGNVINEFFLEKINLDKEIEKFFKLEYYLDKLETPFHELIIHGPYCIEQIHRNQSQHCQLFDPLLTEQDKLELNEDFIEIILRYLALRYEISWNHKDHFISIDWNYKEHSYRLSLLHFSLCANQQSKCFLRKINHLSLNARDFNLQSFDLFSKDENILIAGSTGSGKTTFLSTLLENQYQQEHIIILEDTLEIEAPGNTCTQILSNQNEVKNILKYILRMSPQRIILGELRGPEVASLLLALNTGHKGLLTTIHANSAKDSLDRVALLFEMYAPMSMKYSTMVKLIANQIDKVVYLKDGKVNEIIEVKGSHEDKYIYETIYLQDNKNERMLIC